jgi:hypothetical protein
MENKFILQFLGGSSFARLFLKSRAECISFSHPDTLFFRFFIFPRGVLLSWGAQIYHNVRATGAVPAYENRFACLLIGTCKPPPTDRAGMAALALLWVGHFALA